MSLPVEGRTGWVYDQTQSYTAALVPFLVLYGLATLTLWKVSQPAAVPLRPGA